MVVWRTALISLQEHTFRPSYTRIEPYAQLYGMPRKHSLRANDPSKKSAEVRGVSSDAGSHFGTDQAMSFDEPPIPVLALT